LEAAERERREAEQRRQEADERLREASRQAQEIIDRANRAGEEVRAELRNRGEQEAGRVVEQARREIEGERHAALASVRNEVAELVVNATQKVLGESLNETRHRRLIEDAIRQVGTEVDGNSPR
jgi:F-type H+-transporting ATPase subunit b